MKLSLAVATGLVVLLSTRVGTLQESPQFGAVQAEKNLMVPMRDGVKLATDIYRPAVDGKPAEAKLPLLLHRTAYGKTGERLVALGRYFARNGYVVALQDDRGTYDSEGVQYKYIGMGRDGYDAVEWLARHTPTARSACGARPMRRIPRPLPRS
jgi:predicted acyl esterase